MTTSKITVERLSNEQIAARGIKSWPIWEKEISQFEWYYSSTEQCLLLEGEVEVITPEGNVKFAAGDFVTLPQGLACTWIIRQAVKKHYNFI